MHEETLNASSLHQEMRIKKNVKQFSAPNGQKTPTNGQSSM
jgi:hypothetical protein